MPLTSCDRAGAAASSPVDKEIIECLKEDKRQLVLALGKTQAQACRLQQQGEFNKAEIGRLWQLCLDHGLDPRANVPVVVPSNSIPDSGQSSEPDGSSESIAQEPAQDTAQELPQASVSDEINIETEMNSGTWLECGGTADGATDGATEAAIVVDSRLHTETIPTAGTAHTLNDLLLLDSLSPELLLRLLTEGEPSFVTDECSTSHSTSCLGQGGGSGRCTLSTCHTLPTQISLLAHGGDVYRSADFQAAQTNKRWWALVGFCTCWVFSYQRVVQVLMLPWMLLL